MKHNSCQFQLWQVIQALPQRTNQTQYRTTKRTSLWYSWLVKCFSDIFKGFQAFSFVTFCDGHPKNIMIQFFFVERQSTLANPGPDFGTKPSGWFPGHLARTVYWLIVPVNPVVSRHGTASGLYASAYTYGSIKRSLLLNDEIHWSIIYKSDKINLYKQGYETILQNPAKACLSSLFTSSPSHQSSYTSKMPLQLGVNGDSVTVTSNVTLLSVPTSLEYVCYEPK